MKIRVTRIVREHTILDLPHVDDVRDAEAPSDGSAPLYDRIASQVDWRADAVVTDVFYEEVR